MVFSEFTKHFYEIKMAKDSDNALKFFSKLMLNSLPGKFGTSLYESETKVMTQAEVDNLSCTHNINKIETFKNSLKELVNFDIYPDAHLCAQHGIDYENLLSDFDSSS